MIRTYLYKYSSFVCVLGLSIGTLAPGNLLASSSCPRENSQDPRPIRYKWRTDRCEGVVDYKTSGEPFLISFAAKNIQQFNNNAEIQVRGYSSSNFDGLQIRSYLSREYYLLNNVTLKQNGSFQWSSDVLKNLKIEPKNLWLLASAKAGNGNKYLPIQLGSPSKTYEFVFISNDETTFTAVKIMQGNKIVRNLRPVSAAQPARQPIIFQWDGKNDSGIKVSSGSYHLVYSALSQQGRQSSTPVDDSLLFEHDKSWLSP